MGITGYYDTSKSQAQNYKDAAEALQQRGFQLPQFKKNMNSVDHRDGEHPRGGEAVRAGHGRLDPLAAGRQGCAGRDEHQGRHQHQGQHRRPGRPAQGGRGPGRGRAQGQPRCGPSQAGVGKAQRIKIEGSTSRRQIRTSRPERQALHTSTGNVNVRPPDAAGPSSPTRRSFTITAHVVTAAVQVYPVRPGRGEARSPGPACHLGARPARPGSAPPRTPTSRPAAWSPGPGTATSSPRCWNPARRSSPGTWSR